MSGSVFKKILNMGHIEFLNLFLNKTFIWIKVSFTQGIGLCIRLLFKAGRSLDAYSFRKPRLSFVFYTEERFFDPPQGNIGTTHPHQMSALQI